MQTDFLTQVKRQLLEPADITENKLSQVFGHLKGKQIDLADVYFQNKSQESWMLEDGIVKEGDYSILKGVGVRAVSKGRSGFAYSDEIHLPTLIEAATAAKSIAKNGQIILPQSFNQSILKSSLYSRHNPISSTPDAAKIALLQSLDLMARALDNRVKQVIVRLSGELDTVLVAGNEGSLVADVRPLVRLNVSVVVEEKGKREQGSSGGGGRHDYEVFLTKNLGQTYVTQAVKQALTNLEAVAAPAGSMPVVLGPGWPGVLLHEAIGHGLEGDFNRKLSSAFYSKMGEMVASPLCTIVDDGTLPNRRGSLNFDDEGTASQCTTLIEKGRLKGFMQDKMNAQLMNEKSTGNGRRESYAHLPMPRMTNTYMLNGPHTHDEIIASVDKGIYAVNFGGGQVDITSGKFVFSASEAYLIEKGQVTRPIKGATLIGNGPDILTQVSMLGNNLELDQGIGVCGKEGQCVPVGVGQPTLKIKSMTVGGTQV